MVRVALIAIVVVVAGCGRVGFDVVAQEIDAGATCNFGAFGPPQTDPTLNSTATEWGPWISHDQRTLVFSSTRTGPDRIFQSTRASIDAPWTTPVELAPALLAGQIMNDPSMSSDQLALYWGNNDGTIGLATRASLADDWVAQPQPVSSTAAYALSGGPDVLADQLELVFTATAIADHTFHLYVATRAVATAGFGSAAEISEIATATGEGYGQLSADRLEVVYQSQLPANTLMHATRTSVADLFDAGTVIAELDSSTEDVDGDFSDDGATLWFGSERAGGLGEFDLWWATRSCL